MQIQSFINSPKNSKADFIFGLVVVNILGLGCLFGYLNIGDIDTDGGIFAAVAMKDLNGGTLYQTAWENKPPGIIYLVELLFIIIPNKVFALYALPIIGILFLVSAYYNLAYRTTKSLLSSLLYILLILLFTINNRTIGDALYTEIYGSIFLVWSLYFINRYKDTNTYKNLYISAFLLGFTFWFKEPFIIIIIPFLIYFIATVQSVKEIFIILLYAVIPSLFFLLLLQINDSLIGFLDMIKYNFSFTEAINGGVTKMDQLNYIWYHIIEPLKAPFLVLIYYFVKGLIYKENRLETAIQILLMLGSVAFVMVSPHSFNHYYIPFIILFFCCFILPFNLKNSYNQHSKIWLIIVLVYSIYKLNDRNEFNFKWKINQYEPDRVSIILNKNKGSTLFVDLVDASGYYVKGNMIYPTFLPVPIAAHFGDNKNGLINRTRIYNELRTHKPDFLITERESSYMYWHIPDQNLYYGNYEKIDSVKANYGKNVFLWKLKQH